MEDKKIFKKWWFWLIVVVILVGAIGTTNKPSDNTNDSPKTTQNAAPETSTLPKLKASDYEGKEGLIVYKELQSKGYNVDAMFEKQALTDMNGKASDVFEKLDQDKPEDKLSVDAFTVGGLKQDGDSVILSIAHSPTN